MNNTRIKDIPLVAYDNDGKIVDVEIVPKTVTAKVNITSPSKETPPNTLFSLPNSDIYNSSFVFYQLIILYYK